MKHFRTLGITEEERTLFLQRALRGDYTDDSIMSLLKENDYGLPQSNDNYPQITLIELMEIRRNVVEFQDFALSFTGQYQGLNQSPKQIFDNLFCKSVLDLFPLTTYEANTPEIWDYLTFRLLPDVAVWRFSPTTERNISDRFIFNRVRHVFARWWSRQNVISGSELLEQSNFSEAEWEVVFERPSLYRNKSVAKAALRVIVDTRSFSNEIARSITEEDGVIYKGRHRAWVKSIQRFTSVSTFDAFTEDELYIIFRDQHPLLRLNQ